MKIKSICCIALAIVLTAVVFVATGCTAASEGAQMSITDASGKGTVATEVYIPLDDASGNAPYVKDAQKIAEHLNEKVDELTETKDIYEVTYGGTNDKGEHIIRMSFSFEDINDYNIKAMRLYNCQPRSSRNSVSGMPETYAEIAPTWTLTDKGNGTYSATFSQSAYAFTVMNLWAYRYLMQNDIPDAWDFTGDGQTVQYSLFAAEAASSMVRSIGAAVTLTVGQTTETITLYGSGNAPTTVTVTGDVTGTAVQLDQNATDESIIVKAPAEEDTSSTVEEEKGSLNPWMISTIVIGAVTVIAVIAVAVVSKKKGGKQ